MSINDNCVILSAYDDGYTVSIRYKNTHLTLEAGEPPAVEGDPRELPYLYTLYDIFVGQGGSALADRVAKDGSTLILCEDGYIDVWEVVT